MKIRRIIASAAVLVVVCIGTAQSASNLISLDGKSIPIPEMEAEMTAIMERAGVTGLSCAIINDSKVTCHKIFGYKNRKTRETNDEETIFAAASLSKTVFAYMVMLLVEDGIIELDKPLHEFLSKPLSDYNDYAGLRGDYRSTQITVRLCLTHSTGLAWSGSAEDRKMTFLFNPGDRYKYSGLGIKLLQMVVEEVTGKGLEELASERVFKPLGMARTSFVWQDSWKEDIAAPHDQYERPREIFRSHEASAAGSMYTTAGDYARLLVAILGAEGERKAIMDEMLRSQVAISSRRWFSSEQTDEYEPIHLSWGLGWVRFDTKHGRAFLHIGRFRGCQNYTVTYADKGTGVVFLSNSDNFESVARELAEATIGDTYSPFDWCGYPNYDPNSKKESPLHLAAYFGQRDIVERLLATGADFRAQNRDGRTAVGLAEEKGHSEVVELICKHANRSGYSKEIMTFFDYAAAGDMSDMEQIRSFISKDIDINAKTQDGTTPLHLAIREGYRDIAELLIENDADYRAVNKNGFTPLHISAKRGDCATAILLTDKGADVNAEGTWAITPLHLACWNEQKDMVELLIGKGADIDAQVLNGDTVLHSAAQRGLKDIVGLLLAKGADLNVRNNAGATALDLATNQGHTEIIALLKKQGAKE